MRRFKTKSKNRLLAVLSTISISCAFILSSSADSMDGKNKNITPGEPVVVSEDTSLRKEYEKHFLNSDGTHTAASYSIPVHYQDDATGEWKEIDNTLEETTDETGATVYKNRDGLFDVTFAKNPGVGGRGLVTMESEGHTISWQLIGTAKKHATSSRSAVTSEDIVLTGASAELIQATVPTTNAVSMNAEKATGALVYSDLADGEADVRYTVTPLQVKEDYILAEAPRHAVSYTAKLSLSDGLTPALTEDGGVQIASAGGNVIFEIAAPYMTDAAGEYSDDVTLTLRQTGNHWKLTVTPDLAWLQDDARVYPVAVDPTVEVDATNNAANTWDTYIYEGSTSSGGVTRQNLDRMYIGDRNSTEKKCRGLIKFLTMPTVYGSISAAVLELTTPPGTSTWKDMSLYRITSDWNSATVAWPGPGTSFIESSSAYNGKYLFNVTSAIQDMYRYGVDGSLNNYGFGVRYTNENAADYNSICSSEYGVDTETNTTKPCLTIVYKYYAPEETPGIVSGAYYYFRSQYNGKYMNVSGGNTSPVVQYTFTAEDYQCWRVQYEGGGWYSLAPAYNLNLRLDVPGGNSVNGQNLWIYTTNNTSTQRWRILENENEDGTYRLLPMCAQHENMVLDIEGPSFSNGAPLQIWEWDSSAPQMRWFPEIARTY